MHAQGKTDVAHIEGKAVWIELQTQRPAEAETFYQGCFGWRLNVGHAPTWGALPVFRNGTRAIGSVFHSQAAFQASRWGVFFSGNPDEAMQRAERLGGGVISDPESSAGWGRSCELYDPMGHPFSVIRLEGEDPSDPARPTEPVLVELRTPEAVSLASFYASVLGLEIRMFGEMAFVGSRAWPRILLTNDPQGPVHHPWIPWLRSTAVAADTLRAERYGAVPQIRSTDIPGIGPSAILADPTGAYFGLVQPSE